MAGRIVDRREGGSGACGEWRWIAPDLTTLAALEDVLLTGSKAAEPFSAKIGKLADQGNAGRAGRSGRPAGRPHAAGRGGAAQAAWPCWRQSGCWRCTASPPPSCPLMHARKAARGWLDFDDLIAQARGAADRPFGGAMGAVPAGRRDRPHPGGRGAGHQPRTMAGDRASGAGVHGRAGRAATWSGRSSSSATRSSRSIPSRARILRPLTAMKAHFRARLAAVRTHLADLTLEHSFRSSPAILRLVDLTFDAATGRDLGGEVQHIAFKARPAGAGGSVARDASR